METSDVLGLTAVRGRSLPVAEFHDWEPYAVWGATLQQQVSTPAVGERGGAPQYDFPPRYGKWAARPGLYTDYRTDHPTAQKGGARLTFVLGEYDDDSRHAHEESRSGPWIPIGQTGRRCLNPRDIPPPSPGEPPPPQPPRPLQPPLFPDTKRWIKKHTDLLQGRQQPNAAPAADTAAEALRDFAELAADSSYGAGSCSFGFQLRHMPKVLPRITCSAKLSPSPPPPPPSPPPPGPQLPPPLPRPPPMLLYTIPLHTSCSRAFGGGYVELYADDWDYVDQHYTEDLVGAAEVRARRAAEEEAAALGKEEGFYWFSVALVFERWVEGAFIRMRFNGEGLRVSTLRRAVVVAGGAAEGSGEEEVDGEMAITLRLLEGPTLYKQLKSAHVRFLGVLDEWVDLECAMPDQAPPPSPPPRRHEAPASTTTRAQPPGQSGRLKPALSAASAAGLEPPAGTSRDEPSTVGGGSLAPASRDTGHVSSASSAAILAAAAASDQSRQGSRQGGTPAANPLHGGGGGSERLGVASAPKDSPPRSNIEGASAGGSLAAEALRGESRAVERRAAPATAASIFRFIGSLMVLLIGVGCISWALWDTCHCQRRHEGVWMDLIQRTKARRGAVAVAMDEPPSPTAIREPPSPTSTGVEELPPSPRDIEAHYASSRHGEAADGTETRALSAHRDVAASGATAERHLGVDLPSPTLRPFKPNPERMRIAPMDGAQEDADIMD